MTDLLEWRQGYSTLWYCSEVETKTWIFLFFIRGLTRHDEFVPAYMVRKLFESDYSVYFCFFLLSLDSGTPAFLGLVCLCETSSTRRRLDQITSTLLHRSSGDRFYKQSLPPINGDFVEIPTSALFRKHFREFLPWLCDAPSTDELK